MIEYLDVCNAPSEAHRFSLPYKAIIAAYDSFFANRQVGIDIYGKDTDEIERCDLHASDHGGAVVHFWPAPQFLDMAIHLGPLLLVTA